MLAGVSHALSGVALLVGESARPVPRRHGVLPYVPDWLPALVNAARAFVAVGAVELFWVVTAWPNGARAITFAVIGVIILAPRADQAYAAAMSFVVGTGLTAIFAAIIGFAVLPHTETFVAFSLAIGLVPGARWRGGGSVVADANVHGHDGVFLLSSRSDKPDELRHRAIL